jgi:hypothetical protein
VGALVAGGVDGHHILEAEVPLEVRVQEGHHKRAGCSIHVDLDVISLLSVQLICSRTFAASIFASIQTDTTLKPAWYISTRCSA